MSTIAGTMARPAQLRPSADAGQGQALDLADLVDVAETPNSLADISCWRLLTARVPLTLLVDLALPEERFGELHEQMLAESCSTDWIPRQRR